MNNYYILLSQEKITDYGLHPIIAATSNWIVVVGYEEHQDLLIYDTFDKTLSMIQTGFQHAKNHGQNNVINLIKRKMPNITHPPTGTQ